MISGSWDNSIKIWNINENFSLLQTLEDHKGLLVNNLNFFNMYE